MTAQRYGSELDFIEIVTECDQGCDINRAAAGLCDGLCPEHKAEAKHYY